MSLERRRRQVERDHPQLSIRKQCQLLGLHRSGWYHTPKDPCANDLRLMRIIDEQYLKAP
jgi:putative transposase